MALVRWKHQGSLAISSQKAVGPGLVRWELSCPRNWAVRMLEHCGVPTPPCSILPQLRHHPRPEHNQTEQQRSWVGTETSSLSRNKLKLVQQ